MSTISIPDIGSLVQSLTGHASSAGLVDGIIGAIAMQTATNAATAALTSPAVLKAADPTGIVSGIAAHIGVPLPAGATMTPAVAPAAKPVITATQANVLTAAQLSLLYPNGFTISG